MQFRNPGFDHFKIAKGTLVPSILWLMCLRTPKSVISTKNDYWSGSQAMGALSVLKDIELFRDLLLG